MDTALKKKSDKNFEKKITIGVNKKSIVKKFLTLSSFIFSFKLSIFTYLSIYFYNQNLP